MSDVTKGLIFK
jgi:hypothetical protein